MHQGCAQKTENAVEEESEVRKAAWDAVTNLRGRKQEVRRRREMNWGWESTMETQGYGVMAFTQCLWVDVRGSMLG